MGSAAVVLTVLGVCAGCKDQRSSPPPSDQPTGSAPAPTLDGRRLVPRWTLTVPGTPGQRFVDRTSGPVLVASKDVAIVGSSVIGFAAIEVSTGQLAWQYRSETEPGPAMVWGDYAWLAGSCTIASPPAPMADTHIAGCITVVMASTGAVQRRIWIRLPHRLAGTTMASPRGAVGVSSKGMLLWNTGADVWAVDATSGVAHAVCGSASINAAPIRGVFVHEDATFVLWSDRIGRCDLSASSRGRVAPTWTKRFDESVAAGAAGPVVAGGHVIWVRDEHLEARTLDGKTAWTVVGRFASCASCLTAEPRKARLTAVRLDAAVTGDQALLATMHVDPRSGALTSGHPMHAAPQVLGVIGRTLVLRHNASLKNDWVRTSKSDGGVGPSWQLPPPTTPRSSPVGVTAVGVDSLIFFDGRHVARLPET